MFGDVLCVFFACDCVGWHQYQKKKERGLHGAQLKKYDFDSRGQGAVMSETTTREMEREERIKKLLRDSD